MPRQRERQDILSDFRLANFNKSLLKSRLALLLELDTNGGGANKDDIATHAGQRIIEMYEEIKLLNQENVEHYATIKEFGSEWRSYNSHPVINKEHHPELNTVYELLNPLYAFVTGKEEDAKLEALRRQFEQVQVSPIDWNDNNWTQQVEQTISACRKILLECAKKWQVNSEQAENLKRDIYNTIEGIKLEELCRRFKKIQDVDWTREDAYQQGTNVLKDYGNILEEVKKEWHTCKDQANELKNIIITKSKEIEAKTIQARRKRS